MNTTPTNLTAPEIPSKSFKVITHFVSLLPITIFVTASMTQGDTGLPLVVSFLGAAIYIIFLYAIAGGGDWSRKKYSTLGMIIFFVLTFLVTGAFLYAYWYFVRFIMAKIYKIPMAEAKGRMFTSK